MTKPCLAETQHLWFEWLERDQQNISEQLTSAQTGPSSLGDHRLNIYRNNRFQVLLQTLQQLYPKILALVGGDYFKQLVRLYSRQQPPTQRNLNNYGLSQRPIDVERENKALSFSQFLHNSKDIQLADLDYLIPLAELESALQRAYFSTDDPSWDADGFSQLDATKQMQCHLALSHSLTLLHTPWNLDAIIKNISANKNAQETQQKPLKLNAGDFYFAIYRRANRSQYCAVASSEYHALMHLKSTTIELADWLQQHPCAATSLAGWISCGWITHHKRDDYSGHHHAE